MRLSRVPAIAGLALLAGAAFVHAQSTPSAAPDPAPVQAAPLDAAPATWGDAQAGQTKAGACAACHGLDGNPTDPQYPRLAGMPERYIAQQLQMFKDGERSGGMAAVMQPFAAALSAQDMRDIGAYFARQTAGAGVADDSLIASGPYKGLKFYQPGERIYRGGIAARGVPACMACHGPAGEGNPGPAYPALHGQQSAYVVRRLQEYQAGTTNAKDPTHFNLMAAIAKPLTDEEIQSLASYVQGLHARAPAAPVPAQAP